MTRQQPRIKRKRVRTHVSYNSDADRFAVPVEEPGRLISFVSAPGELVRGALVGQLPRNGAHLRDVIMAVSGKS
jgi:hypothetical protein